MKSSNKKLEYGGYIGKILGRLYICDLIREKNRWYFLCECECGEIKEIRADGILAGQVVSCGCYNKEAISKRATTHGQSNSDEYNVWKHMLQRCYNPNNDRYENYGGRGIKVCDEWHDFNNFYRDMGKRPSDKYSIERRDVNGDYCKENCYWAIEEVQHRNRTNSVFYEYNGKKMIRVDWAKEYGIPDRVLRSRLESGWDIERALHEPIKPKKNNYSVENNNLTHNGVTKSKAQWARELGISKTTLSSRINLGWDIERIVTTPSRPKRKNNGR